MRTSTFTTNPRFKVINEGYSHSVVDKFVRFFDVNNSQVSSAPYFFWGSIKGVNIETGRIFAGSDRRLEIRLSPKVRTQVFNELKVSEYWQLLHKPMICFGWLEKDKRTGALYVKVSRASRVAFLSVKKNSRFVPFQEGWDKQKPERIEIKKNVSQATANKPARGQQVQRPAMPLMRTDPDRTVKQARPQKRKLEKGCFGKLWEVVTGDT